MPYPLRNWHVQQQMSAARQFQDPETQQQIDLSAIRKIPTFILQPEQGGAMTNDRAAELAETMGCGYQVVEGYTSWTDFYTQPGLAFKSILKALHIDLKELKRKVRQTDVKDDL